MHRVRVSTQNSIQVTEYSSCDRFCTYESENVAKITQCEPVAAHLNSFIGEGFIPKVSKSADMVPVQKIHLPRLIELDLRPVSLLPVLANTLNILFDNKF